MSQAGNETVPDLVGTSPAAGDCRRGRSLSRPVAMFGWAVRLSLLLWAGIAVALCWALR